MPIPNENLDPKETLETETGAGNAAPDDVNLTDETGGKDGAGKAPSPADMANAGKDKEGVESGNGEAENGGEEGKPEGDMFPRPYVEKLRKENATYRDRAKAADELATRLHTALVAADGRLASPDDLPYDPAHLEDSEALEAAITKLITTRPGLRAQRISGDIGQGNRGSATPTRPGLIEAIRGY